MEEYMTQTKVAVASGSVQPAVDGQSVALPRSLSTFRLAVFVIAAVAPLACVIGVLPVALVFGSGTALPLAFVVATVVTALFAVGYSAFSREVVTGGAFYTYIAHGLGPVVGLGAAGVAVASYTMFVPGGFSYLGYMMQTTFSDLLGFDLHWVVYSLVAWVIIGFLGLRQIDFSARVVLIVILIEFMLLLFFDAILVGQLGSAAFPAQSLDFSGLLGGAPGVAILLAFTCYFGIESAALFSEEAKSPQKSVARATYIAIFIIGIFYFITSWITIGAIGPDNIKGIPEADVGLVYFKLSDKYVNDAFTTIIQAALVTSMFATVLSMHNVAARYLFVLGRQGFLPRVLGRAHPVHGAPTAASASISVVALIVFTSAAFLGLHPMLGLGLIVLGFAAVGVMFMQALTSVAVVSYFRKHPERHLWQHVIAPILAFLGLLVALYFAVTNFEYLSGSQNPVVNRIPIGIPLAMAAGIGFALWLRRYRPAKFAEMQLDDL
ncbi:APC family permease [Sphingorhabdus lacus]|uniref:APC family permease n=2 Tax=Sphingorhabdus TaxID=1434046 RepID=A0A6I6L6U5_9SPHN|nr:APC family permease [Sphingorhabdus lacus]